MFGMFADNFFVGSAIDAVNLVAGNVAVDPLNLRAEVVQYAARLLRNSPQVRGDNFPAPGISRSMRYFGMMGSSIVSYCAPAGGGVAAGGGAGFFAAGTTGGFFAAVAGAGVAGALAGIGGAAGCFSEALTTPVCGAGVGFAVDAEAAGGAAFAAVAEVVAGWEAALALGAAVEPDPAAPPAVAVHGGALATVFLCPKSELMLVIAALVFPTALSAVPGAQG